MQSGEFVSVANETSQCTMSDNVDCVSQTATCLWIAKDGVNNDFGYSSATLSPSTACVAYSSNLDCQAGAVRVLPDDLQMPRALVECAPLVVLS
jgi:hypothetical protein